VLEEHVPSEGTAWTHAREELRRFFERILTQKREEPLPDPGPRAALALARTEPPEPVRDVIGAYLESAALLGQRTADLHLALASNVDDPAFVPEPYTTLDRRSQYQSMRNLVGKTLRLLRGSLARLPAGTRDAGERVADAHARVLTVVDPLLTQKLTGLRIRTHGDYRLEQVLYTGKDFVIVGFDGPPAATVPGERRRKHSPLRDVAGMIRSFSLVAAADLLDPSVARPEDRPLLAPWSDTWHRWISGAFLRAYLDATVGAPFIPAPDDLALVLTTQLLERAFIELRAELAHCNEAIAIPLDTIVEIAGL
jgi:maltose alpha-D-glucosyltransferase/alpha-amylase